MYQIYCDKALIYDPRGSEVGVSVRDCVLNMAVGSAGSLTFTIDKTHPQLAMIKRLVSIIDVLEDGITIFRGRVIRDTRAWDDSHVVEVEGLLACLNDSVQDPYSFPSQYLTDAEYIAAAQSGNVIEFWLSRILQTHNEQVSDDQKIYLGDVTVIDPNNYIYRESEDPSTTWELLTDKFSGSSLGGYFVPRYEPGGVFIDYLEDFGTESAQEVRFAVNLMDYHEETQSLDMFNSVYAIGDGITLADAVDGEYFGKYIKQGRIMYDPVSVENYGKITKIMTWEDVSQPENLLNRVKTALELNASIFPKCITVTAADIHAVNGDLPAFRIGQYIRVESAPHGISESYPLMQLSIDILDPGSTQVTVARSTKEYTNEVGRGQATIKSTISDIKGQISKAETSIKEVVTQTSSSLVQDAEKIESLVSRINELESMITQIRQTAEGLDIKVTKIETEGVDKVRTEMGYTFSDDGLIIRRDGDNIITRTDNEGFKVTSGDVEMLVANGQGVRATDLTAKRYFVIGCSRFEDFDTKIGAIENEHFTGCFWVGGGED